MVHTPKMANCHEVNVVLEHVFLGRHTQQLGVLWSNHGKLWGFDNSYLTLRILRTKQIWDLRPNIGFGSWKIGITVGNRKRHLSIKIGECTMSGSKIIKHMDLTPENWDLIIKRMGFHHKKQAPKRHTWQLDHQRWSHTLYTVGFFVQVRKGELRRHLQPSTAIPSNGARSWQWLGKGGSEALRLMGPGSEFRMWPIFLAPLAVSLAFVDADVINVIPLFFFFAWLASYSHVLPWPPPYSWLCQYFSIVP